MTRGKKMVGIYKRRYTQLLGPDIVYELKQFDTNSPCMEVREDGALIGIISMGDIASYLKKR